jgi:hypothetical protein
MTEIVLITALQNGDKIAIDVKSKLCTGRNGNGPENRRRTRNSPPRRSPARRSPPRRSPPRRSPPRRSPPQRRQHGEPTPSPDTSVVLWDGRTQDDRYHIVTSEVTNLVAVIRIRINKEHHSNWASYKVHKDNRKKRQVLETLRSETTF